MKVRMKVDMSGTLDGRPWPPRGAEHDVPDRIGAKLCAAGHAEPVADTPTEKAVDGRPAEKRRGRPPGSKNKPRATTDAQATPDTGDGDAGGSDAATDAAGEPNGD